MTVDPTGTPSQAVVQITLGQVFNEVTGLRGDVRDLANSVKTAVAQLGDHETRMRTLEKDSVTKDELTALEGQIQELQRGRWKTAGAAVAVSVVASSGVVGVIATKMLGH